MIAYILPSPKEIDLNVALIFILACFDCSAGDATAQDRKPDRHTYPQKLQDFDPDNLDDPTEIDNESLPMKPGTRLVYEETTLEPEEGGVPARRTKFNSPYSITKPKEICYEPLDRGGKNEASTHHGCSRFQQQDCNTTIPITLGIE